MNNENFQVFSCKGSLFERWKFLCIIYGVCRRENRNALPLILLFLPMYAAYFLPLRPSQKRPFYIQACEWLSPRTLLKKDDTNLGFFWKFFLLVNDVIGSALFLLKTLESFSSPWPMCNGVVRTALLNSAFWFKGWGADQSEGELGNVITLPKDRRLFHVRQWSK